MDSSLYNLYNLTCPVITDDQSFNPNWLPRILFSNVIDLSSYLTYGMDIVNSNVIRKLPSLSLTSSNDIYNADTYSLLFDSKYSYIDTNLNNANTLYKKFYRKDILSNIDDNAYLVTYKAFLNADDLESIDFANKIKIGNTYYYINSIKYKEGLSDIELIKLNYIEADVSNYIENTLVIRNLIIGETVSAGSGSSGGSSGGGTTADVNKAYVDGSLALKTDWIYSYKQDGSLALKTDFTYSIKQDASIDLKANNASLGLYVLKAGDIMSGHLDINASLNADLITVNGTRPITLASGGIWQKGDAGGWATNYGWTGSGGTGLGGFGAFGNADSLDNFYIGSYSNQLVSILTNGNVGIGTTLPTNTLTIVTSPDGTKGIDFSSSTGINVGTIAYNQTDDIWRFHNRSAYTASGIMFSVYNTDVLKIDRNGNVGIGTTTPTAKLDVNGNIKSNTIESSLAYVTGFDGDGFKLVEESGISSLEVDNLTVRNILRAYEMEINKMKSIGGTLVISVANGTAYDVFDRGDGDWNIIFDEDSGNNLIQFLDDDYIRGGDYTGREVGSFFGKVVSITHSNTLGSAYARVTPLNGTPWAGIELVQFGNISDENRQKIIMLTLADGSVNISGLSDVSDGNIQGHEKFRLGKLDGLNTEIFGDLSGFGLYADEVYLKGTISANAGNIGGWDIDSSYIGKNTGFDASSAGMSPSDYPFYAGSEYTNRGEAPFRVKNDGTMVATKFLYSYILSDDIIRANDTEESTIFTSFVRLKKITLGSNVQGPRTLRIVFSTQGIGTTSEAQIIRNDDVSVGTLVTGLDNDYQTLSEDISGWNAGDSICLYVRKTSGGVGTAYVKDFRLLGTHTTIANEVTGSAG